MDLLRQFVDYLNSQKDKPSKATVKNYKADVNQFFKWFEKELKTQFEPTSISPQIVELYKKTEELSPRSIERHLSSLRKFFQFLKVEGIISHSPLEMSEVRNQKLEVDPYRLSDFKSYLYVYNASHLTIKNYIIDIRQFLKWTEEVTGLKNEWNLKDKNLYNLIDSSLLEEYKNRLRESGFSPTTINRKLSSLRKYLAWAKEEGLLKSLTVDAGNLKVNLETRRLKIETRSQLASQGVALRGYSHFPPIRLGQKVSSGISFLFDSTLIAPLAKIIEIAQYAVWKLRGRPIFEATGGGHGASSRRKALPANFKKEFYAPHRISTKYFPWHKKLWHHARHTRPQWYREYHSYPVTHYFHIAILVVFMSALGFGLYNAFFRVPQEQAPALAAPIAPLRILSFQGRLTDASDNPITTAATALRMAIYNNPTASGAALLWQEIVSVSPDTDGIFSVLLGNNTAITQSIFAENASLYLGVSVGQTPELTPRQQLATVAYATNAEVLQGLPPVTDAGVTTNTNAVLALNSSGTLAIAGAATTTFQATSGQFTFTGQPLRLQTNAGSAGNIQLAPDGLGTIDLQKPIQNSTNSNNISTAVGSVEIGDLLSVLATSSGQSAFTINQTSTGPLISASTSGTAKFTVGNDGSGYFAGNVGIGTTTTSTTLDVRSAAASANAINIQSVDGYGLGFMESGVVTGRIAWDTSSNQAIHLYGGSTDVALFSGAIGIYFYKNLTMQNNLIVNIGDAGTDFTSGGGLTLAGALLANGDVTLGNAITDNITFTGRVAQDSDLIPITATGTNDLGASDLPWDNLYVNNITGGSSGVSGYWQRNSQAISPTNITDDLLLGATSTSSAKFGILNMAGGNPTATMSGNLSLIVPTTAGANTLNLLNNSTLNIQRSPGGDAGLATALFVQNNGNVGIGTTSPSYTLDVAGTIRTTTFLTPYNHTIVVAKSGGDYTTITAALNAITDNSSSNLYIIRVMPGSYNEQVTMKQYVDIIGSGWEVTTITYTDADVVTAASNARIEGFTINLGTATASWKAAVYANATAPTIINNKITADGNVLAGGIMLAGNVGGTIIEGNEITPTGSTWGIIDSGNGSGTVTVRRNKISNTGASGGGITTASGSTVTFESSFNVYSSGNRDWYLCTGTVNSYKDIISKADKQCSPTYNFRDYNRNDAQTALTVTQSGSGDILNLFDGSTEVFSVIDGGNVGIGTTSPGAPLDIQGAGGALTGGTMRDILRIENTTATATNNSANMSFFNLRNGAIQTPVASISGVLTNNGATTYTGALVFSTAGTAAVPTERVRIDSSGNVGIGTTVPLTALDVTGSASLSANLSLRGAATAHTFNILDNGTLNVQRSPGGDAGLATALFVQNNGNVGIGTTGPGEKLEISGNTKIGNGSLSIQLGSGNLSPSPTVPLSLRYSSGVGGNGTIQTIISADHEPNSNTVGTGSRLILSIGQGAVMGSVVGLYTSTSPSNGALVFETRNDGSAAEKVRIDNAGNVGIGNTTPLTALDVTGSASLSANLSLRGAATAHTFNILDNGTLNIQRSPGGDAGLATALFVQNNGNVGIGTTAPATKLEVAGNVKIGANKFIGTDVILKDGGDNYWYIRNADDSVWRGIKTGASVFYGDIIMSNNLITGIGDANTAFTSGGGLNIAGNVGIGTTAPAGALHVVGNCVTGDTLLRRLRRKSKSKKRESKITGGFGPDPKEEKNDEVFLEDEYYWEDVRVDQIEPEDEILTLDEESGQFVVQKVKKLMRMGKKKIYKIITASGKTIRTTDEHPYLALTDTKQAFAFIDEAGVGKAPDQPIFGVASLYTNDSLGLNRKLHDIFTGAVSFYNLNKSRFEFKFNAVTKNNLRFFMAVVKALAQDDSWSFAAVLTKKKKSWNYWSSYLEILPRLITKAPFAKLTVVADYLAKPKINKRDLQAIAKLDKVVNLLQLESQGSLLLQVSDVLLGALHFEERQRELGLTGGKEAKVKLAKMVKKLLGKKITAIECLHAVKNTLPQTLLTVKRQKWVKVKDLSQGAVIATVDGWEKIVKIEYLPQEEVFDIEVENTHNFVANGIVAHNTYVMSGSVGIGNTAPLTALDITGSASVSANMFLRGAGTAHTFNILDNGTFNLQRSPSGDAGLATALFVQNNGNVGIGTTGPGEKLEVSGNTKIGSGSLSVQLGSGSLSPSSTVPLSLRYSSGVGGNGTIQTIISADHDPNSSTVGTGSRLILSIGQGGVMGSIVGLYTSTSPSNGALVFETRNDGSAAEKVRIDNAGNVGIGNTAPLTALDITGSASVSANMFLRGAGTAHTFNILDNGTLNIQRSPSGDAGLATALFVQNNGNVGIGTTSPGFKLEVNGIVRGGTTTGGRTWLSSNGSPDYGGNIYMTVDLASTQGAFRLRSTNAGSGIGTAGSPNFSIDRSTTAQAYDLDPAALTYASSLVIDGSNGNVGIGDATPDYLLDVAGTAGFDSTLTMTGSAANIALGSNYLSGDGGDEGISIDADGVVTTSASPLKLGGQRIYRTVDNDLLTIHGGTDYNSAGIQFNGKSRSTNPGMFMIWTPNAALAETDRLNISGAADIADMDILNSNLNVNSGQLYVQQSTGKVGIGITAPLSLLDIQGAVNGKSLVNFNYTGTDQNIFTASKSGALQFYITNAGSAYASSFYDIDNTSYFLDPAATGNSLIVAGKVGIGNTTPLTALDVTGSASVSANMFLRGAGTAHTFNILDNGTLNIQRSPGGDAGLGTALFVQNNGNVGIGTTAPATGNKLEVNGNLGLGAIPATAGNIRLPYNSAIYARNSDNSDNYRLFEFDESGVGSGRVHIGRLADVKAITIGGNYISVEKNNLWTTFYQKVNFAAQIYGGYGAGSRVYIDDDFQVVYNSYFPGSGIWNSSGNVGIGTTTPLAALDVRGLSGTLPAASVSAQTSFASLITDNAGVGDLFTASKSGATKFVVTNAGNVGIGTGTPATQLDVNGNIYSQQDIARKEATASSTDATQYSTQAGTYVTVKTFNLSISGDRLLKRVYWKGDISCSAPETGSCPGYVRLINADDGETVLSAEASTNSASDDTKVLTFSETYLRSLGLNGNANIAVQLKMTTGGSGADLAAVNDQTIYVEYMPLGSYLKTASATDATQYSTIGTGYTTVKTFNISISGDRIIKRLYWKGDIKYATGGPPAYLRLINADDGETVLGTAVSSSSTTDDTKTIIESEYDLWSLGFNGNANIAVQMYINVDEPSGTAYVNDQTLYVLYTNGAVAVLGATDNTIEFAADVAEYIPGDPGLEPGDVVRQSDARNEYVTATAKPYDEKLIGVVSTKPFLINDQSFGNVPLVLAGRVPVKVSTENGPVFAGDPLTSSSIPGVAMKATKAGQVIGKALEPFECSSEFIVHGSEQTTINHEPSTTNCQGKILAFVNLSWYDPDVYITSAGDYHIAKLASQGDALQELGINPQATPSAIPNTIDILNATYLIHNTFGQVIDRVGAFAQLAVANLKAGFIDAQEIVSPIAQIDRLQTDFISPLASDSAIALSLNGSKFIVHSSNDASSSAVATIDSFGNASFSGQLQTDQLLTNQLTTNDATVSGTLRADKIIANNIEGLDIKTSTLSAQYITNNYYASPSAEEQFNNFQPKADPPLAEAMDQFVNISSYSAQLAYVENLSAATGIFTQGLTVLGPAGFTDLSVANQFSIGGNLVLADSSIDVLGSDLSLQPLKQGGISMLAGLVRIDIDGNVYIEGSLTARNAEFDKDVKIRGVLSANILSPIPGSDLVVRLNNESEFRIENASGSALLTIDSEGIATFSGQLLTNELTTGKLNFSLVQPALAVSDTELIATGSAGVATISTNKKEVTINNSIVTDKSLIYLTPIGTPSAQAPFLMRQIPNQSFTVGVQSPNDNEVPFNWLIIN